MRVLIVTSSILLLASSAPAVDDSIHAKLMGRWQQSDANGESRSSWDFEGAAGVMHVINSNGTQTVAAFECNTVGKECLIEDAGRRARVSMWFNGSKLVEMETRGSQVVKRRFSLTDDNDSMDLETIPIVPSGKSETAHFRRVPSPVAKQ